MKVPCRLAGAKRQQHHTKQNTLPNLKSILSYEVAAGTAKRLIEYIYNRHPQTATSVCHFDLSTSSNVQD